MEQLWIGGGLTLLTGVMINQFMGVPSVPHSLTSGMPQGSVIGPFGFPTYTLPMGRICEKHGVSYHFYIDDNLLYLAFNPQDEDETRHRFETCTADD